MTGALAGAPLIGAAVGAVAGLLYGFSPLLAVAFWAAVPRLLGEPYLLVVSIIGALVEWQIVQLAAADHNAMLVCIAAQAVPRAAVIALAWISRPAAEPPGYARSLTSTGAWLANAQGIAVAFAAGVLPGMLIGGLSYLAIRLLRAWAYKRDGGITQGWLAIARVVIEVCVLLALSVPLPAASQMF